MARARVTIAKFILVPALFHYVWGAAPPTFAQDLLVNPSTPSYDEPSLLDIESGDVSFALGEWQVTMEERSFQTERSLDYDYEGLAFDRMVDGHLMRFSVGHVETALGPNLPDTSDITVLARYVRRF